MSRRLAGLIEALAEQPKPWQCNQVIDTCWGEPAQADDAHMVKTWHSGESLKRGIHDLMHLGVPAAEAAKFHYLEAWKEVRVSLACGLLAAPGVQAQPWAKTLNPTPGIPRPVASV